MIRFLQSPGKVKKYLLGGLLVFISITMLLYLIPQGGSNITGQPNILARVGDDNITIEDVARRAEEFQRSQGRQIPPAMMPQLVDYMITDRAQLLQAQRLGLRVSDAELKDELQHGPLSTYIFPDGKFVGQEKYQNFVTQQLQSSVEHFEEQERNYILQRKLTALVTSNISVTPADIEREYQRQNLKVKLQYAVVSLADLSKQITVTEPEIKAYYQSHKSQYENSVPEKRKAKYAVIDVGKLAAGEQISPSELLSYYNQHKSEFQQQEEIKASHILIKT
ncbi:MAG TPA: SurA N-terminal domain-containing protein, partial [Terriglobales bacterium]|nr:SurA N-terminal domain-containing protein [Terriglobales bacterium]